METTESKKTKPFYNALIPSDWEVKIIEEFGEVKRGAGSQYITYCESDGIRLIRINDFFENNPVYVVPTKDIMRYAIDENDILFAGTGASAGASYIPKADWLGLPHSYNAPRIRVKADENRDFLLYALQSDYIARQQKEMFVGAAQPFLDTTAIANFKILTPNKDEQRSIANILSLIDTAINKNMLLIAQIELRKKWLMQNLLTGKKRLKGFEGEWKEVKLGKLFKQIRNVNDGSDNHSIMTISSKLGLISQEDKFDRVIAGDSLKKYTQLRREDFAYNKGNSKTYPMGCIYQLEEKESALVPFVYICFSPTDFVDSKFYKQWFLDHGLDRQLMKIITSGARGDGLLNVNSDDFFKLKVPYPPKEEQAAIAQVLQKADVEIQLLQTKLDKLKEQKKGLMQVLLTGKKRLKIK